MRGEARHFNHPSHGETANVQGSSQPRACRLGGNGDDLCERELFSICLQKTGQPYTPPMAAQEEIAFGSVPMTGKPQADGWRLGLLTYLWFPLAYLIFGVVGLLSSLLGLGLAWVLPPRLGQPLGQRMIQRLFAFFVWYLQRTGLACFDFHDLTSLRDWRGGILVANHPCLVDVVFLISRLPRVFCLMKTGVLSNLVLCGTARLAGYVDNQSGRGTVMQCTTRLRAGDTLVIFPEGTRTVAPRVNPFKLGFALISQLSGAPVQTILIESNSPFLGKHWPFLKPPSSFPLRYSLKLGQRFCSPPEATAKEFGRVVENYFRATLPSAANPKDWKP